MCDPYLWGHTISFYDEWWFVVSNVLGLDACYGRTYLNMEMAFGSGTNVVDNFYKNT